jgi:hypothetical protein
MQNAFPVNISLFWTKTGAFPRHLYAQIQQKWRFYSRFWSKKGKYWPEMHCALVYFYNGLMCLICTNISLYYFCILGYPGHWYAKTQQKWRFYPRFWSKKGKYLPEMYCALVHFYSGLMCLICTNINLLYFCITGFLRHLYAKILQNVLNYFPRIFNPSN